jgi:geranylgeranyl pyrophosphate synthase
MILEGSLLHYGSPRVVRAEDSDLALLLGDQLYALGLARLAALGDLEAVAALADVISGLARAHAEGNASEAAAIWERGASAIGWGATRS